MQLCAAAGFDMPNCPWGDLVVIQNGADDPNRNVIDAMICCLEAQGVRRQPIRFYATTGAFGYFDTMHRQMLEATRVHRPICTIISEHILKKRSDVRIVSVAKGVVDDSLVMVVHRLPLSRAIRQALLGHKASIFTCEDDDLRGAEPEEVIPFFGLQRPVPPQPQLSA